MIRSATRLASLPLQFLRLRARWRSSPPRRPIPIRSSSKSRISSATPNVLEPSMKGGQSIPAEEKKQLGN